jgi:hypothetical protein
MSKEQSPYSLEWTRIGQYPVSKIDRSSGLFYLQPKKQVLKNVQLI